MKTFLWRRIGAEILALGLILFAASKAASAHPGPHGQLSFSRAADHFLFDPFHEGLLILGVVAVLALTALGFKRVRARKPE